LFHIGESLSLNRGSKVLNFYQIGQIIERIDFNPV